MGAAGRHVAGLVRVLPRLRGSVSMATELFTVVALPHSRRRRTPTSTCRCSSPRGSTPDGAEGELRDVPALPPLGGAAQGRRHDRAVRPDRADRGEAAARRRSTRDVWDAVFPPDTPVRGPQTADCSDRQWRTFRAGEVHDAAKLLHLAAMFSDPTSPAGAERPPAHGGSIGISWAVERAPGTREYDESRDHRDARRADRRDRRLVESRSARRARAAIVDVAGQPADATRS